ncbi:MAG: hypothetical protein IAE87_15950 [Rhodobacteraceae bacterium]|jgi:hypothetical protein|nr:hypothetical protein [Paracoccaceae bacterium]
MKFKSLSLALITTALVGLTLPSLAEDGKGPNIDPTATGTPGAPATLAMAYELFALGKAEGDALTVLTAAKLAAGAESEPQEPVALDPAKVAVEEAGQEALAKRKAVPAAPAAPAPITNGEPRPAAKASYQSGEAGDDGTAAAPPSSAEMFALATELAGDDETMKELIADAQAEASRGRIGGAVTWNSRVTSGQIDVWEIPFYGNSYAEIAVSGDGDANLDVVVTDENGNVICYDTSFSDQVYCDFVPAWDGYFYVMVENAGQLRNSYYLMTN